MKMDLLIERSFEKARELGFDVVVIFGNPDNYVSSGFQSGKKYNICSENGGFPAAMLVKELRPGVLDGRKWYYRESAAYQMDSEEAEVFDRQFKPKEKRWQPSQEVFYILSHTEIQ